MGEGMFLQSSNVTVRVGAVWRQEIFLQFVLQEHVVLRREAQARSERDR